MSKAEINKCLKELSKAKMKANNLAECAELCNYIGEKHSEKQQYQEAIHYHQEALTYSEKDGDSMGMALARRCLGECHTEMSNFEEAAQHIGKYIKIVTNLASGSKKIEHYVEIQRAWTTLARTYLTQAQELMDDGRQNTDEFRKALDNAEKNFDKATKMADTLGKSADLPEKEYPEMKARLLLNMALVKDMKGKFKDAIENLREAIDICETHKLKEDLYLSQFNLANIYRQRGHGDSMKLLEASIATAKQLRNSKSKLYICESYIQKGLLLLEKRAFQKDEAMKCFYLAYEEESKDDIPNDDALQRAIKLLKLSYVIYINYNKLQDTSLSGLELMKTYDKLGDCFTELKMYKMAINYYEQALVRARTCNRSSSELASIYISIAESYSDSEQYEKAIEYYEKELQCRQGNDEEQCRTLIKIAQMKEYLNASRATVIEAYNNAYNKTVDNPALRHQVLKSFVPYLSSNDRESALHRRLEEIYMNLQSYTDLNQLDDNDEQPEEESVADDIALDDILAEFQDDDYDEEGLQYISTTGRSKRNIANRCSKKFKINDFGETPLHQACIKGDLKAVRRLLDMNHPVNPVENSGWLPIHEAANNGHAEIVDLLIKKGAKIDFRGWMGITPLHDAARNGRFDIVDLLIKNKANVIVLDDKGSTALDSLMEWKSENQQTMSNSQLAEYQQTKLILEDAMSKAGFNFQEHRVNRLGCRGTLRYKRDMSNEANKTRGLTLNLSKRTADDSPPPDPIKEYKSAITDLRRTTTTKKITVPERDGEASTSLGALTVKAEIKDWLIDDVTRNKRPKDKQYRRDGLEDFEESNSEASEGDMENDDVTMVESEDDRQRKKRVDMSVSDDDDIQPTNAIKLATSSKRIRSPVFSDDESSLNMPPSTGSKAISVSGIRDPISACMMARDETSSLTGSDRSAVPSTSSLGSKMNVKVEIDGKTMAIQADSGDRVEWLLNQVTERYMSFADLEIKPTLELYNEDEDFPLFSKDLVRDAANGKLRAIIKSWNLPPIFDRYIVACKKENLQPMLKNNGLNPSQLFLKLEEVQKSNKLDLSNCRIPRKHVVPLLQSLARDNILDLDISGSNIFLEDEKNVLFTILPTLDSLRKLHLNCCGLNNKHFEALCQLKLPRVTYLYVSYNNIDAQDDFFVSRLNDLGTNFISIKCLDIRWNNIDIQLATDFTESHRNKFKILFR